MSLSKINDTEKALMYLFWDNLSAIIQCFKV